MKKALDQTVRSVKREVNKKVLKVPEIERKVLEATCNEPWGPHGTLMADIAQATRNYNEYQMIMTILWKRLNDSGKNWRHVMKSLTVMEFLVGHGAERFIDDLREHTYQIQTLVDFQYIDSHGRDQGLNVRRKAQGLVALINDKEKIRECRQKAAANRDKYRPAAMYRSSSYTSTGPTYGDREDDERYGGSYGDRYGDKYGGDRSRDRDDRYDDRYRDGERYRDGDRYDGQDKERDRPGYEDARSSGSKDDDDWRGDRRQGKSRPSPPSYEEVASPSETRPNGNASAAVEKPTENVSTSKEPAPAEAKAEDEFDPRGALHASASDPNLFGQGSGKLSSTQTAPSSFFSEVEELFADTIPASTGEASFDDTNPFGTPAFHATSFDQKSADATPFQNSSESFAPDSQALALVPSEPPSSAAEQPPAYSQFQPQEFAQPATEGIVTQQPPAPAQHSLQQPAPTSFPQPPPQAQPFTPQSFVPQQPPPQAQQFPQQPPQSFGLQQQPPQIQQFPQQPNQSFAPQHPFSQQATPGYVPQQQPPFPPQQTQGAVPFPFNPQQQPFPRPAFAQQQPSSFPPQQQQTSSTPQPFAQQQIQQLSLHTKAKQQEKFEPKSAVWADTLSSGLVDLNIGPLKHDPLAELGIHLVESKVSQSERRKEEKTAVPATKGKAMGSGSGLGLAGASIMHRPPPPPPPIMGGGMGMGMNAPMMGMNAPMMPPPGMAPMPMMNPMMGMGMGMGYSNPQQSQFGGYR